MLRDSEGVSASGHAKVAPVTCLPPELRGNLQMNPAPRHAGKNKFWSQSGWISALPLPAPLGADACTQGSVVSSFLTRNVPL